MFDWVTRTAVAAAIGMSGLASAQHRAGSQPLEDVARRMLRDANGAGFIHVRDVRSGRVLVHVSATPGGGPDPALAIDSAVRPLSVIKVFVAASWLEHGLGDAAVQCAASRTWPVRRMLVDDMLITGCDSAGAEMAILLRRRVGAARVLADLRQYGLPDLTLTADANDAAWGSVLSLGEEEVPVTPRRLSEFLRAIGQGGAKVVSPRTARRLSVALEGVVQHGTATGISKPLTKPGWHIGGKTGTGPGQCGDHCDGWFASLVSDRQGGRYVILVFIKGKGLGGGVAARTAAAMAEYLAGTNADWR